MARSRSQVSSVSSLLTLLALAAWIVPAKALYLYMEGNSQKCFFEDLPSDTMVVGHYNMEHWDHNVRAYVADPNIQAYISVEETFDNDHRIVSQRSAAKGRFTFSAADSGEHRICLSPIGAQATAGAIFGGMSAGSVRLTIDMAIGATSQIESNDKGKLQDLQQKVRDLNARLQDIRREQVFQRVSCNMEFHRKSPLVCELGSGKL
ncbi:putative endosomal cargo receptor [Phyllosticta citriasiana]|uniref:putative endosomal cargo receptor n=1 Tax=Phyllosticta citriasiana TaxID=595635 RepID=UPI0030FD998B